MNVGDKVEFVHSKEKGVIVEVLDRGLVAVETQDGFVIPVLQGELIYLKENESDTRILENTKENNLHKTKKEGLFLAFEKADLKKTDLYLINNTDFSVFFTLFQQINEIYLIIGKGNIESKKVNEIRNIDLIDFGTSKSLIFHAICYKKNMSVLQSPISKEIRLTVSNLNKPLQNAPLLNKKLHLFRIDSHVVVDTNQLREKILEKNDMQKKLSMDKPELFVDLHIEELADNYDQMTSHEILALQLNIFQQKLDAAIAWGVHEIRFIHGFGKGILKKEIHKQLKLINKQIKYHELPDKGITIVEIK